MQAVQFLCNYECFNGKVMLVDLFFFSFFGHGLGMSVYEHAAL